MARQKSREGDTADQITAVLREEIIRGELRPEAVLYQEELAARFEASRMPVRDSLKILEREGLVLLRANKSATVAPLDPDSFFEINEMRAVAEPLALRLAIPELSNRQIEKAIVIQDLAEQAGLRDFGRLNKEFHMTLMTPCNRPRLLAHIASLSDLSQRYFQVAAVELDYAENSHKEHRALVELCMARETDKACAHLAKHIHAASRAMFEAMMGAH